MKSQDIALLSLIQIKSLTKKELIECCRTLKINGYSKWNKQKLSDVVFEASNVLRTQLKNRFTSRRKENPVSSKYINELIATGMSIEEMVKSIRMLVLNQGYSESYLSKGLTKKFMTELDDTVLEDYERETAIEVWKKENKTIDKSLNLDYWDKIQEMRSDVNEIDSTKVIEWALNNLTADRYEHRAYALSILGGRRRDELFGDCKYKIKGKFIVAKGISKKKGNEDNTCVFIPLCSPELWIKTLNSLPERGCSKERIKNTIGVHLRRRNTIELKDLKITSFHQCRKFYAGLARTSYNKIFLNQGYDPVDASDRGTDNIKSLLGHVTGDTTKTYSKHFNPSVINEYLDLFELYDRKRRSRSL